LDEVTEENMSRIHDALRKAEQERASHSAQSGERAFADLTAETLVSTVVEDRNSAPAALASPSAEFTKALSFEMIASRCAHPRWEIDPEASVFEDGVNGKVGAEAFRTLSSRLFQSASTTQLRRVLITSSAPGEGKSFVAANLAQSLARQPKSRVLLIDADLRISQLNLVLGAPNKPGLTNYLRGETDEISVIQMDTEKRLSFIPAGDQVADPSELILSGRMKKLLDLVTSAFNWVIVDSPPALAVHDASMLADLCDGVLFVVKSGETNYESVMKATSEFRKKNLLGVVLNHVEKNDFHETYYYSSAYGSGPK
jgi:capsular exopolysaccharide synthesis family protein